MGKSNAFAIVIRDDIGGATTASTPKPSWPEFAVQTYIRSGRGITPFIPFDYQIQLERLLSSHDRAVIAKTRQLGLTEFVANYFLWQAYQDPAYLAVIFSKTQDDSSDIAKRVRLMAAMSPLLELDSDNTKDITLKNGGRLLFKPSTPNAARGVPSAHALFFDECGFVTNIEEIYGSSLPATEMVEGSKVIMVSTPPPSKTGLYWDFLNGQNDHRDFETECDVARSDGLNYWTDAGGWLKFIVHWKSHPIYRNQPDYLEKKQTELKLTHTQTQREFNLSFSAGGNTIIRPEWFTHYRQPPHPTKMKIVQSWDTAATRGEHSAHWGCTTWGIHGKDYYLLDAYWAKHQYADGYRAIVSQCQKWNPYRVLIEDKSTGITLLQELPKDTEFRSHCVGIKPKGSKVERLDAESLSYESRRVLHPQSAPWLSDVEGMLVAFPAGDVLDVVDSISQFLHWARAGVKGWGWG